MNTQLWFSLNVHLVIAPWLLLQLVMPGDRKEMSEFQDKTAGNTQTALELTLPNVSLLLPSKDFFETLYNRWVLGWRLAKERRCTSHVQIFLSKIWESFTGYLIETRKHRTRTALCSCMMTWHLIVPCAWPDCWMIWCCGNPWPLRPWTPRSPTATPQGLVGPHSWCSSWCSQAVATLTPSPCASLASRKVRLYMIYVLVYTVGLCFTGKRNTPL